MRKIDYIKSTGAILMISALALFPFAIARLRFIVYDLFIAIMGAMLFRYSTKTKKIIKIRTFQKFLINIAVSILAIILLIAIIEGISFSILKTTAAHNAIDSRINCTYAYMNHTGDPFTSDSIVGVKMRENYTSNYIESCGNGTIIFNKTYSTDEFGRRTFHQAYNESAQHIVLFGCSYTFGWGMNDTETLSYFIWNKNKNYNVYNYGVSGYGPSQMLALLQSGKLPEQILSKKGYAFYIFMRDHLERTRGKAPWLIDSPYYYLDSHGNLNRRDFFKEIGEYKCIQYLNDKIKPHSSFLQLINFDPYKLITDKGEAELTYKIIEESKKEYEKQFNGSFYVFVHPCGIYDYNETLSLLEKNKIPYIISNSECHYILKSLDEHPTAETNEQVAGEITGFLENLAKNQ